MTFTVVGKRTAPARDQRGFAASSALVGLLAALALAAFYATTLALLGGGWQHVNQQFAEDAPWVLALVVGFGVQGSLMAELRRRHRLDMRAGAAGSAGAGASTAGMIACCAHHVADLLPLLGLSGAAVFLTAYRTPLMAVAIALTAVGIGLSLRRLRARTLPVRPREDCHVS